MLCRAADYRFELEATIPSLNGIPRNRASSSGSHGMGWSTAGFAAAAAGADVSCAKEIAVKGTAIRKMQYRLNIRMNVEKPSRDKMRSDFSARSNHSEAAR